MLGVLLKNWKLLLDIILVIALVVLLFLWNPLGIFGGGLTLRPTANMVEEVREMGQLVTASYYGEVIASIEEARMDRLEEEEIGLRGALLYENLYRAANDLFVYQSQPLEVREAAYKAAEPVRGWRRIIRQSVNSNNILDKLDYHQLLAGLSEQPLYEDILAYIWSTANEREYQATHSHREEALFILYTDVENKRNPSLNNAAFTTYFYQRKSAEQSRRESRQKLAMIGRGWVKAGFDLSGMDENMFYINEEAGEIHFFGLSAVILNADINPWFIPEKGVPGFEILDYRGKVDFRDARQVKQYCIDKLVANAQRAEILLHAERQGAEILRNLFSLMTGNQYKKVFFHHDDITQLARQITADEFVSYQEAVLLDSQILQEIAIMDSLKTTSSNRYKNRQLANHREKATLAALAQLRRYPFEDMPGHFSYFSRFAYESALDSVLDDAEHRQLETMRLHWPPAGRSMTGGEIPEPASFWLHDSLAYQMDYTRAVEYLLDQDVVAGKAEETILLKSTITPAFLSTNWVQHYTYTHPDSVKIRLVQNAMSTDSMLLSYLYPFNYEREFFENLPSNQGLWLDSIATEPPTINDVNDSTVWVYETQPRERLRRLNFPLNRLMNKRLLENLNNRDVVWVTKDLCFIRDTVDVRDLDIPNVELTPTQSREMAAYYHLMLEAIEHRKTAGPVVRASEWVQKKFENNKSVKKWLSELNRKIWG